MQSFSVSCRKCWGLTFNAGLQGEEYMEPMSGELSKTLSALPSSGETYQSVYEFLRLLVLCNDVIPQTNDKTGKVEMNSASPDEVALCQVQTRRRS